MNADRVDLLRLAHARPWQLSPTSEGRGYGAIVSTDPESMDRDADLRGRDHVDAYGGVCVAESVQPGDRELIVAAVNEYEHLLAVESSLRSIVGFIGGAYRRHADEALARLDEIREGGNT